MEIYEEPLAMIFSADDRCQYFVTHKEFPNLAIRHGQPMPAKQALDIGCVSEITDCDAEQWLLNAKGVEELTV